MSRNATAATMKGRVTCPRRDMPKAGTRLRAIYDVFQQSRGLPLRFQFPDTGRARRDLEDYYGLDIRKIRNGEYVLAGEWFGKVYVDYIAERMAA